MIRIEQLVCDGCGCCVSVCLGEALVLNEKALNVWPERCTGCGSCIKACPLGALTEQRVG